MMNTIQKIFRKIKLDIKSRWKADTKSEGSTLVITLILCGMIISVGLGVVRILASELQFSADLLWSEKAYFAAESGVEKALLDLKGDPILHKENQREFTLNYLNGATTDLTISNKLDRTNNVIKIPQSSAVKLRLKHKIGGGGFVKLKDLRWNVDGSILWKVICTDKSLTGRIENTSGTFSSFGNEYGDYSWMNNNIPQLDTASVSTFWDSVANDKKECWLSLQNISSSTVTIKIDPTIKMPPEKAKVRSVGKSGEREKIVEFLYRQKNLSPYFDFGFIQQK